MFPGFAVGHSAVMVNWLCMSVLRSAADGPVVLLKQDAPSGECSADPVAVVARSGWPAQAHCVGLGCRMMYCWHSA
jgi:hypothetical protein